MTKTLTIDERFEQAYRDLDRFIEDKGTQIKTLLAHQPSGRIVKGHATYAEAWEIGFRRCLAELEKASAKL